MPVPTQRHRSQQELPMETNTAPLIRPISDTLFSCNKRRTDGKMGLSWARVTLLVEDSEDCDVDGRGGGLDANDEGVGDNDDKGEGDGIVFGSSAGISKLEMSSPSWANSAMVVPTGIPLVPFCAYVRSVVKPPLSNDVTINIPLFCPRFHRLGPPHLSSPCLFPAKTMSHHEDCCYMYYSLFPITHRLLKMFLPHSSSTPLFRPLSWLATLLAFGTLKYPHDKT